MTDGQMKRKNQRMFVDNNLMQKYTAQTAWAAI